MTYESQYPHHPAPKKSSTGKVVGFSCLGVALVGVLMAGGCMAMVASVSDSVDEAVESAPVDTAEADTDTEPEADESEETYAVGDTVSHGNFDIVVDGVETGVESYTDSFDLSYEPSGQFIVVTMTATNTSSGPEYIWEDDQVLMDDEGRMYTYSSEAYDFSLGNEMNPGQTLTGELVFDVPADVQPDHMLVNGLDSFSEGVRVDFE